VTRSLAPPPPPSLICKLIIIILLMREEKMLKEFSLSLFDGRVIEERNGGFFIW